MDDYRNDEQRLLLIVKNSVNLKILAMKSHVELLLSFYIARIILFVFLLSGRVTMTVHYAKLFSGAKVKVPCANSF